MDQNPPDRDDGDREQPSRVRFGERQYPPPPPPPQSRDSYKSRTSGYPRDDYDLPGPAAREAPEPQLGAARVETTDEDTSTRRMPETSTWEETIYIDRPPKDGPRYSQSPPPLPEDSAVEEGNGQEGGRRRFDAVGSAPYPDDTYPRRSPSDPRIERVTPSPYPAYRDEDESRYPYRPSSRMSDDGAPYDKFEFVLPSRSLTETTNEADLSDSEPTEVDDVRKVDAGKQNALKATGVYSSHYTGNAELGGNHTATLTVLHDPKGQKAPLFRWLHIRQDVMNLDDFWSEVSRQPRLTEPQKSAITKLRADLKKQSVKTRHNPKGSRVGYMDPRFMEVPIDLPRKKATADDTTVGSVKWVCIPYFALQPYSGLLSASSVNLFPSQSLLQSQYDRTPQQRDMDQAVSQLGNVNKGECFHIAQLWCLVLENSFLVTCGSMSQSDLNGDSLQINTEPAPMPTAGVSTSSGRIFVSYGDSLIWSFTTAECPTWFSFITRFNAFWPDYLEFQHCGHAITAKDWPKILKLAGRPRGAITLTFKKKSRREAPLEDFSELKTSGETGSSGNQPKSPTSDYLPVLTLFPQDSDTASVASKDPYRGLKEQLSAADKFLAEKTNSLVRRAYADCKEATRDEVYNYLVSIGVDLEQRVPDQNDNDLARAKYRSRVSLFNTADMLFCTFLPATFDGPTANKFWGAIRMAISMPDLKRGSIAQYDDHILDSFKPFLAIFVRDIQAFQSIMSHANAEDRANIEFPRQFVTAWLHIMSALMYYVDGGARYNQHVPQAQMLTSEAIDLVVEGIATKSLLDSAAVLPMEVLSLIARNLLADQVGKADDISETYSQYLNLLDTDITTKPSDRSYQHRVNLVQQEMTAIKRTLSKQLRIIRSLGSTLTPPESRALIRREFEDRNRVRERDIDVDYYGGDRPQERPWRTGGHGYLELDDQFANELASATKLSPTDAGGLRGLLMMECAQLLEQREYEFRRYTDYAEDLERAIVYKVDWTKDRQENAIYAFTLVTIIFLPLSSVASIFGMNTTDVRDMPFSQWLYWATALPVTLIVIVGGLWWMSELGNVMAWITGQKRHRSDAVYPSIAVTGPSGQPPPPPEEEAGRPQVIAIPEPKESRTYETAAYSPPEPRTEKMYETMAYTAPVQRMDRIQEPEEYSARHRRRNGTYEHDYTSGRRESRAHRPEPYMGPIRRRYGEELSPPPPPRRRRERGYFDTPSSPMRPRMRAVYRY